MNRLFRSQKLGDIELPNRIVMAPVVRARAGKDGRQPAMAVHYYASRATAGLLVTEPVEVGPTFAARDGTPGFWTPEQIDSWCPIVEEVHAAGGRIALELCYAGKTDETAPATTADEFKEAIARFRSAARTARTIGFDGIEIGASTGHLAPCGSNLPGQHAYNLFDVLRAAAEEIPLSRVGVRVPPMLGGNSGEESAVDRLGAAFETLGIAYLHLARADDRDHSRSLWLGRSTKIIGETNRLPDDAATRPVISLDAVSFALPFISNPDLVHRAAVGGPYNGIKHFGMLGGGSEGYLDYLTLEEEEPADVGLA